MRGRAPANNVPATARVCCVVSTVMRTSVWYSLGRSCTVSATSMPRSRASTGALTMLAPTIIGPSSPASAAAVSGRWFRCGGLALIFDNHAADHAFPRQSQLAGEGAEQAA